MGDVAERKVRAQRLEVYRKLLDDGEVHKDELSRALELCGFVRPRDDWIEQVAAEITGFNTLSEDEFLKFVKSYARRQRLATCMAFETLHEQHPGSSIQVSEIEEMLLACGLEPMSHVLEEVLVECNSDASGSLHLADFECLVDTLRTREGFVKRDYDKICETFRRFDYDGNEEVPVFELGAMMNWLGLRGEHSEIKELVWELEQADKHVMAIGDFVACARKMRESQVSVIKEAMARGGRGGGDSLTVGELRGIMHSLGFPEPSEQALLEAAEDAGLGTKVGEAWDVSEVWKLISLYREREGLDREEVEGLAAALRAHDRDGSGELDAAAASSALISAGYQMSFNSSMHLVACVDVAGSGKLGLAELLKMARMHRAELLQQVRGIFSALKDQSGAPSLSLSLAWQGLLHLDLVAQDMATPESRRLMQHYCKDGVGADLAAFTALALDFGKVARAAAAEHHGFGFRQARRLRDSFRRYDLDGGGTLEGREIVFLIEDVLPDVASDAAFRPRLLELTRGAGAEAGRAALRYRDFLKLMSKIREYRFEELLAQQQAAAKALGFPAQELPEWREVFLDAAQGAHGVAAASAIFSTDTITVHELTGMLCRVAPLDPTQVDQLTEFCKKALHGHTETDFVGFLRVVRQLHDANFAGLSHCGGGLPRLARSDSWLSRQSRR